MQELTVALIVAACTGYAVWTLMPSALRRALAQRLLHGRWPEPVARRLRRAASAPIGCGCDAGCEVKKPSAQTIHFHRRPKA